MGVVNFVKDSYLNLSLGGPMAIRSSTQRGEGAGVLGFSDAAPMDKAHRPPAHLQCGKATTLFLVAAVLAVWPIGVLSGPLDPPSCRPGSYARGVVRFCALDTI